MALQTDILNVRSHEDITETATDGAYIHGFFLEGAGWELGRGAEQGYLTDMVLKDLHPVLPVMHITAVDFKVLAHVARYRCPAYQTSLRGGHFVFECLLAMESEETEEATWVLAGVALLMAPE